MKQLSCSKCYSFNFFQKDGLTICSKCGAKYTQKEVEAMVIQPNFDCFSNQASNQVLKSVSDYLLEKKHKS